MSVFMFDSLGVGGAFATWYGDRDLYGWFWDVGVEAGLADSDVSENKPAVIADGCHSPGFGEELAGLGSAGVGKGGAAGIANRGVEICAGVVGVGGAVCSVYWHD
jgi:hypothetical protein